MHNMQHFILHFLENVEISSRAFYLKVLDCHVHPLNLTLYQTRIIIMHVCGLNVI